MRIILIIIGASRPGYFNKVFIAVPINLLRELHLGKAL